MSIPTDEINWTRTPCARLYAQGVDYWFDIDTAGKGYTAETPAERDLRITRAKAECATCPLTTECLQRGQGHAGVWGGQTFDEREPVCRDQAGTDLGLARHRRARQTPCPACWALTVTGRTQAPEDAAA